jgi:hypothetical protein
MNSDILRVFSREYLDIDQKRNLRLASKWFCSIVDDSINKSVSFVNINKVEDAKHIIMGLDSFGDVPQLLLQIACKLSNVQEISNRTKYYYGKVRTYQIPRISMLFLTTLNLQANGFYVVATHCYSLDGQTVGNLDTPSLRVLKLESVNHAQKALDSMQQFKKLRLLSLTLGPEQETNTLIFSNIDTLQVANYQSAKIKLLASNIHTLETRNQKDEKIENCFEARVLVF